MACNGNNHADNCQCNFGKGGRPTTRSFVWKGWRPKSVRGYFTGPNATCPECRKAVFYIPFKAGGGAYFDTFGPPWPKHPCTNNPPQYSPYTISGKPKLRSLPTTLEKDGWFPFIARNVERLASGTIVHGVGLENPTTFHFGAVIDSVIDLTRPRVIYEMATRGLGATVIARKLNADGVPAFKSKDGWYQSIIKALLSRTDVIGTFQPHRIQDSKRVPDGDAIENYFPAAIDKDLFLRVQAMRSNPGRPGRKGDTFANLLTGLCHCAHCGGPMTMKMSRVRGNENGRYLVCANYVRGHRCTEGKRHFRYEPLEAAILDHVKELNLADALQTASINHATRDINETIAGMTIRLDELRRKEQRLALAVENDSQPLETILDLLRARQDERHAVEAELRHHQNERQRLSVRNNDRELAGDHIRVLRTAWEAAEDADARYALRSEAHAGIRELVSEISFDSAICSVTVIVANGMVAYSVQEGQISGRFQAFAA